MKKLICSAIAVITCILTASAQDYNHAAELFEKANESLSQGNFDDAAKNFTAAAQEASQCSGEEAAGLVEACRKGETQAMYGSSKELINAGNLDLGLESLDKTIAMAVDNNCEETAERAKDLKQQVLKIYANNMIKAAAIAKSAEEKAANYNKAIEKLDILIADGLDDAKLHIQKGQVLKSLGKKQEAIDSFNKAKEMGEESAANKQLSKLYLQEAQANMTKKNYAAAIESALKSTEYENNATAYKIAGTAANADKQFAEAVEYLGKYLELAPDAKDAAQIKAAIATLKSQTAK